MSVAQHDHTTAHELDARNRAAQYLFGAQHSADLQQQQNAIRQATDFQQMLWLRYYDQCHEMNLQREQHRQAMEMEQLRQQAALELKRAELALQTPPPVRLHGIEGHAVQVEKKASFWESKLFLTILTISLPIILAAILQPSQRDASN